MIRVFKGLSKIEWRILSLSSIGMATGLLMLANPRVLYLIFPVSDQRIFVGHISMVAGDVRLRSPASRNWEVVQNPLEIHTGDVVMVGKQSRAQVSLPKGVLVEVFDESVLRFGNSMHPTSLDMGAGRSLWTVDGEVTVYLRGEPHLIRARSGVVEINIKGEEDEPELRVVKGEAYFEPLKKDSEVLNLPLPIASAQPKQHVWRVNEVYRVVDQRLRLLEAPVPELELDMRLAWSGSEKDVHEVQVSSNINFSDPRRFYSTAGLTLDLHQAFAGSNYWRVSQGGRIWSRPQVFHIEARFLDSQIAWAQKKPSLNLKNSSELTITWESSPTFPSYIVEKALTRAFPVNDTEARWVYSNRFVLRLAEPGPYFLRVRGVNERQELGEYSGVLEVTVTP